MAVAGGVATLGFGVWHIGVPGAWDWASYMADDPPELWIAVRATNLFMGLSLALLGLWSVALPLVEPRSAGLLRGWCASLAGLWTVRLIAQIVWPQGTGIAGLAPIMGGVFGLVALLYAIPAVAIRAPAAGEPWAR